MKSIGQCYLEFVNKILTEGKETYKDSDHHLKESLGNYYLIDDPLDLKFRAKYQHMTPELMLQEIKSGKFDIDSCPIKGDALYEYVKSFEIRDDQGFVYTYPNRILEHFGVDQFETMKQRILTATGSNRAVAVTIDPALDGDREDIPCLQVIQILVRDLWSILFQHVLHNLYWNQDERGSQQGNHGRQIELWWTPLSFNFRSYLQ